MDLTAAVDSFFAGKPYEWTLFEALHRKATALWPDTQLRVMKTCISFDAPRPYMYISFPPGRRMEGLLVSISLRQKTEHPRFYRVVRVSASRYTVHIRIRSEEDMDEKLFEFIAASRR